MLLLFSRTKKALARLSVPLWDWETMPPCGLTTSVIEPQRGVEKLRLLRGRYRVGGSLTASLLPHHRAYGSVHGGSCRVRHCSPQCPPPCERPALSRGFRPLLPASGPLARHLLKAVGKVVRPPSTCSALHRLVRLLRPLLTPAAPSRRLAAPVAHLKPGAGRQASQGKTRDLHAIYLAHIRPHPPGDIGLRASLLPRPDADASYAPPVRQAGTLLTASFRPRLATTPLLFG